MARYLFAILFIEICASVMSFNLEARIPVIKRGEIGSYFGYAVAEHQQLFNVTEQNETILREKSWILVGAPLGQNLQPNTTRSGALFQCPLSTDTEDCTQVITDGLKTPDGASDSSVDSEELVAPSNDERKDNQWLGVTVKSQGVGGIVMVCAHRHIVTMNDSRWGQGQCYILAQDLKLYEIKKPCSGKPTDRAHEQYGYCQAGTSGILTSESRALIGTPGPFTWRGGVYLSPVSEDYLERDTTVYESPMHYGSPVDKYSYLGMSVTAGNFFGKGLAYAAGAPRSNSTGQVVIMTRTNNTEMIVSLILDGEQLGSSYGYEIAAADVNGDKIADLIVSAPFYFDKAKGGAVYVYTALCIKNRESPKCKPTKLYGPEGSRFGFALANLSDLNKDGFEDIAIGAPYEGEGAVYIYLGSKNGIITVPSQVIHSKDTRVPLRTFGYSLSGGIDMDKNGYPDLLVGAYDNDAVALLRARKIIDITTFIRYSKKDGTYQEKIEAIDPYKFECHLNASNYTCFTFEACCKSESISKNEDIQYLQLNYYIEAETFSGVKKFSRVWFGSTKKHYVNRIISLNSRKLQDCQEEIVYLKENTRDIQSPIKFRLNYTLIQDEPVMPVKGEPLPDINNYPILNQQEAARIFEAAFQKDCGDNDICESDLQIDAKLNLSASPERSNLYDLLLGEMEEVVAEVTASNIGESAYEAQLFISHSPRLNYIASKSNESVICNLHNKTLVICSLGNPFRNAKSVIIQVRFDPKDIEDESRLDFIIFANSTSTEITKKKPTNLQAIVIKRAELSIKGSAKPNEAQYSGPVIGESAIKYFNQVGPKVSHSYVVSNEGPWKVKNFDVYISWPYEVANDKRHGKWLLYMEELPTVEVSGKPGVCTLPVGYTVNHLKLLNNMSSDNNDSFHSTSSISSSKYYSNRTSNHIRERRDTEKVVTTTTIIENGRRHQIVSMNCKAGTAKCFNITCTIHNLQRKKEATIIVKARLWNPTLVEDYPHVNTVRIGSKAKIVIPPDIGIEQDNNNDDEYVVETIATPYKPDQQEAEPVPIWIIILSIIAGLLLLILLILVLWKLGFFKRRRPDPTLSGNLEKHREVDNPANEALFKH